MEGILAYVFCMHAKEVTLAGNVMKNPPKREAWGCNVAPLWDHENRGFPFGKATIIDFRGLQSNVKVIFSRDLS